MKKLLSVFFILGLLSISTSFADEDLSGGECKNKTASGLSKEEVINLDAVVAESDEEVSVSSDQ